MIQPALPRPFPRRRQLLPTRYRSESEAQPLDPALTNALAEIFQTSFSQVHDAGKGQSALRQCRRKPF